MSERDDRMITSDRLKITEKVKKLGRKDAPSNGGGAAAQKPPRFPLVKFTTS